MVPGPIVMNFTGINRQTDRVDTDRHTDRKTNPMGQSSRPSLSSCAWAPDPALPWGVKRDDGGLRTPFPHTLLSLTRLGDLSKGRLKPFKGGISGARELEGQGSWRLPGEVEAQAVWG